jgi:hypothetical protein
MRLVICMTVGLLAMGAVYAQEAGQPSVRARPVQIVSCDDLPARLDFKVKPMGYKPGFQIYYLLEGENLVGIKKDSLVLDFIKTASGSDISKHRNGKPAYEQGSFPKVSEDGKHGVFSVEVEENQFGKLENLSIKGTITVLTGSQRKEQSVELSVADKQKKKVGPFSVAIASGGGSLMGMGSSDKTIGVELTGPLESIIEIKLLDGAHELNSEGWMSDGSSKTFSFSKPRNTTVSVSINHWTDLKEEEVPLDK